jgi:hypothetical protein
VWPRGIAVFHPRGDGLSGMIETEEQRLIQSFIDEKSSTLFILFGR